MIVAAGFGECLTYTIYHSPVAFIAELLDLGADPNWPSRRRISTVDRGADVPAIGAWLTGPPRRPRNRREELLLDHGCTDVQQRELNDYTPLHWAAGDGDLAMVDLLLAHGADPDDRAHRRHGDGDGSRPGGQPRDRRALGPLTTRLDWEKASRTGDVKVLTRMVRAGHDVDARDGYGQTALMHHAQGTSRPSIG